VAVARAEDEMTHDPKTLQAIFADAAPPDLDLSFRPMFGGIMVYADGKAFATLADVGLSLKVSGALQAEYLAAPGARPLRYAPDAPPSKSYVTVPDALLADRETLRDWIARAAAGLAVMPAKARRQRGPGSA
jgi:TfoX/Sxy family transcriptional regulator of competence genes